MRKRILPFILIFSAIFLNSCIYDFILPEEIPDNGNNNQPISFAVKVLPIFTNGSKCTSCHLPGGAAPDLTVANAYAAIVPKYLNTGSPNQSKIYTFPLASTGTHTWKKYSATEAATILKWIEEGAKNN